MSKLIENIKRLAGIIKNETQSGGNTAARVGGLFEEIGAELENKYDRTETDGLLSGHDTAAGSHRNIQDRIGLEMNSLDLSLTEKINQADQKQTAAVAAVNQALAGHSADHSIHKTSEQIRGEIVDADLPASLARVADVESRDAVVLQAARQHTDSNIATLSGDVHHKDQTYTRQETDSRITALGDGVYRKAETYTRAETDNRDAAALNSARQYTSERIAEIIGNSPATLDTLCKIANALNNDPDFATSIMTVINGKAPLIHTHTQAQITDFPASLPASDVYPWAKAAAKPAYTPDETGAAPAVHSHAGVYQPVGSYAPHIHSHTAGQISEDTDKHFLTNAERLKLVGIETTLTSAEKEIWNGKFNSYSGNIPQNNNIAENLNNYLSPGVYTYAAPDGTVYDRPTGDHGYGILLVLKAKDFVTQIIFENDTTSSMYIRTYYWKLGFMNWRKI